MIYTLTCNPALDYVVRMDKFKEGATNRSYGESIAPGGKGINVSLVLKNLGIPTLAMGIAAGFTGDVLLGMLEERGVPADFIRADGFTRINVKIHKIIRTNVNNCNSVSCWCNNLQACWSKSTRKNNRYDNSSHSTDKR